MCLVIGTPITFIEQFKAILVQFFIYGFRLLSCKLEKFTFKVLY